MASAADEVAGLDKVLTRLAVTEDVNLQPVLQKLIPAVIRQLKSPHDTTRKKVLEILGHVNKRLKGLPSLSLPLSELVAMACGGQESHPMVRSFALVYTETAFERATPADRLTVFPELMLGVSSRAPQQRQLVLRLALAALEGLTQPLLRTTGMPTAVASLVADRPAATTTAGGTDVEMTDRSSGGSRGPQHSNDDSARAAPQPAFVLPPAVLSQYPFLASEFDRSAFLDAATKLLLYVPQSSGPKVINPLQAAQIRAGTAPVEGPPPPPPGLSAADVAALTDKSGAPPSGDILNKRKIGVLNFLSGGVASPTELLLPLLVASCDPHDSVARLGEDLLKRTCPTEGPRPAVNLESSPQLLDKLFALFHGTATNQLTVTSNSSSGGASAMAADPTASAVPPEQRTQPASAAVRSRILALLCRSVAATSVFPATILTIQEAVYGGSTGASASTSGRLRAQGMEFAVWVAKHCPTHQLKAMAPTVLEGLLRTLHMAGEGGQEDAGPLQQDHAAVTLRGFAYQAVGCLATRVPEVMAGRVDLARSFFQALAQEPPGLRATVAEATAALASAFKVPPTAAAGGLAPDGQQWPELDTLLLTSVGSGKDAVRLCAVQWANRIHPGHHVPSRWVDVLAASDNKLEVREEGCRGLGLNPKTLLPAPAPATATPADNSRTGTGAQVPCLSDLLQYATRQVPALASAPEPNKPLPLNPRSYMALLRYAQCCWQRECEVGKSQNKPAPELLPDSYILLLEGALTRQATGELLVAALEALMEATQAGASHMEARLSTRLSLLQPLLSHTDNLTRVAAARVLGIATAGLTPESAGQLLQEVVQGFGNTTTGTLLSAPTTAPPKFETQEGSLTAAGFVLAQCLVSKLAVPQETLQACVAALLTAAAEQPSALLAATATQALGHVGIAGGAQALSQLMRCCGYTNEDASKGTPVAAATAAATATASNTAASTSSSPSVTVSELQTVLGPAVARLYQRVSELSTNKDAKVAARAVSAAGLLAWSWSVHPPAKPTSSTAMEVDAPHTAGPPLTAQVSEESVALKWLQSVLVSMATYKNEEVQFTAGEAVALLFGGVPLPPSVALRTPFTGLADTFAILHPEGPTAAGDRKPRVGTVSAGAAAATTPDSIDMAVNTQGIVAGTPSAPDTPPRQEVQQSVMSKLLTDMVTHSRVEVRCAASVWLVSLLTYSGQHPAVRARLSDIQDALGGLLGDTNELTQEMSSRGVSILYDLGSEEQRSQLVQSLVQVLQGTGARAAKVKLQGDTKVFEEGSVGQVPGGGSLSTYQELCSLATELGQPDLVYKFMDLAHHQQALNTRRGAAFGFAGVAKLAGDALAPHVQALVPKLYRYQYDPNPRVQDAMASIWRALVADPKTALDKAYPELMKELIKELGGRLWRNRQASCGALADLIQGRRWPELSPYLAQIWTMTFRVMDDIKESVRQAGEGLVRSLRSVTLRLCDQGMTSPKEAREATGVLLPLMLDQGLLSSVKEVRAISLDVVSKVAKTAGPDALKPLLPKLVEALLEGLSSLEDARLNYLEQHAERFGIDSEKLDSARSSAARASPLGDTLELAARIAGSDTGEGGSLAALLPVLSTILNRGVGLNTKVGTARFIRGVATRAASEVKPHAPALLKPLLAAIRKERSLAVRKAYAGAAAQVCKYASDKRVEKVVGEAVDMYASEGADSDSRLCGGLLLKELLHGAPEAFNAHATRILPMAFGARMDDDSSVAGVWTEVWEEGCSSEAGALRLYSQEITAILCTGLTSQQWGRKKACAAAITAMTKVGSSILPGAAVGQLCEVLLSELPGRLWDGKESLLVALGALAQTYTGEVMSHVSGGHGRVLEAALTATERKKTVFRSAALTCLHSCLTAFPGDYLAKVSPILLKSITKHTEQPAPPKPAAPTATTTPATPTESEEEDKPLPLTDCLNCLTAAVPHLTDSSTAHVAAVVQAAVTVAGSPLPWAARLAAVQLAQAVCDRAAVLLRDSSTQTLGAELKQHCAGLLAPVAAAVEELQLQQVRSQGLSCLQSLLQLAGSDAATGESPPQDTALSAGGATTPQPSAPPALCTLPAAVAQRMVDALQVVIDTDKSAAHVSVATRLKGWLAGAHPGLQTKMDA